VFERMNISLKDGESAEIEFRKAYYKHRFDYNWNREVGKIEAEYLRMMGRIYCNVKNGIEIEGSSGMLLNEKKE
jgi:hypothetical protein